MGIFFSFLWKKGEGNEQIRGEKAENGLLIEFYLGHFVIMIL